MRISVRVTPQASKCAITREGSGDLRIKLTKGAHDGEANQQLIEFLAKQLHISRSEIQIVSGAHNRTKVLEIPDVCRQAISAFPVKLTKAEQ